MRWFEHRATDRHSAEVAFAEHALGERGYARFFKLCEVVAERGGTADNFQAELRLDGSATTRLWLARELGISLQELGQTLTIFAQGKLIDPRLWRKKIVRVPQLLERLDEWTKRARVARKRRQSDSRGVRKAKARNSRAATETLRHSLQSQHHTVTEQGGALSSSSSEALSNARHSQAKTESDDASTLPIAQKLTEHFPGTSPTRLAWAVQRIRARAKTTPRTVAYYKKSLPALFENLPAERDAYLVETAHTILVGGSSVADIAEQLKTLAARFDLDYNASVIDSAIVAAERKLRVEKETEIELHAGAGPVLPR